MSAFKDLTGLTINNLLVLERIGTQHTHALYICKCLNCEFIYVINASNIRSKRSNGCKHCYKYKIPVSKFNEIYLQYTQGVSVARLSRKYNHSRSSIKTAIKYIKDKENV